jgi:membrane-associated protein
MVQRARTRRTLVPPAPDSAGSVFAAGSRGGDRTQCCLGENRQETDREKVDFLLPYLQGALPSDGKACRSAMIESIQQLLHTIYDVQGIIQWGGILLICTIVFVETGLFVGFFLPGDSLLVTAGIFAAAGHLNLATLLAAATVCGILGDQVGYWIGRRAGKALYGRKDSLFFKRRHLDRARQFYDTHGGKTIVFARFIPILRTFCPVVAGAAEMSYARFVGYNITGGTAWVCGMVLAGFFLASLVPNISQRIHYVIAVVIFLSFLPPIIGVLRARSRPAGGPGGPAPGQPEQTPSAH